MTWKEFKDYVEQQGVKDTDKITFIDISLEYALGKPRVFKDLDVGWAITD